MRAVILAEQAPAGSGVRVAEIVRAVWDWPEPAHPAQGEVLVRVEASALNHMDIWVGCGIPGVDLTYPRVSGCDVCGVVEAVGEGVHKDWAGKRVVMNAAVHAQQQPVGPDPVGLYPLGEPEYELIGEHHHGAHRERFCAPVAQLRPVGDDADPKQAAAFGLVTLTAWEMLRKAALRPGQTLLVPGAGGGVATALVSLAKHMGCQVAVTSRHAWKLERAAALGADLGVLDEGQDWSREVRGWTNKRGVDVVADSVGKAVHTACVRSLARGGTFVTCGCTSGPNAETDLARVFWSQLRLVGSTMGGMDAFTEVVAMYNAGAIEPVVDTVFPWAQAPDAWARLEAAEQFGKIVLDWTV